MSQLVTLIFGQSLLHQSIVYDITLEAGQIKVQLRVNTIWNLYICYKWWRQVVLYSASWLLVLLIMYWYWLHLSPSKIPSSLVVIYAGTIFAVKPPWHHVTCGKCLGLSHLMGLSYHNKWSDTMGKSQKGGIIPLLGWSHPCWSTWDDTRKNKLLALYIYTDSWS